MSSLEDGLWKLLSRKRNLSCAHDRLHKFAVQNTGSCVIDKSGSFSLWLETRQRRHSPQPFRRNERGTQTLQVGGRSTLEGP